MDNPPKGLGPNDKEDALNDAGGFIINEPTTPWRAEPPIMAIPGPLPCADTLLLKVRGPIEEAHLISRRSTSLGKVTIPMSTKPNGRYREAIIPTPPERYLICMECVNIDIARFICEKDGEHGECKDPKWTEKSGRVIIVGEYVYNCSNSGRTQVR
ncbi:hypothetical protein H2248_008968 [Termitomyces sp. 'cryptogamus']|nr:hypothetical protein H2248_008968 [Termitomyces sp. 'cryptogamus']